MSKWVKGTVAGNVRWTDRLHARQGRGARSHVRRRAVRPPRAAGAAWARRRRCSAGPIRSSMRRAAGRTSSTSSLTVPEGPLSPQLAALAPGDPRLAAAERERLLYRRRGAGRRRAVVPCDRDRARPVPVDPSHAPTPWMKFGRIVLVHAVRHANELAYRDVIGAIGAAHRGSVHAHRDGEPRSASRRSAGGYRMRFATDASSFARVRRCPPRIRTRCSAGIRR